VRKITSAKISFRIRLDDARLVKARPIKETRA
jgi:hypothetical protein